jgi:hypothetical protein
MVLTMILVGVVVVALAVGVVWWVITRGSRATTITESDFDQSYDEMVAKGEIPDTGREEAWRDFNAWQVGNEHERRSWEENEAE